MAPPFRAQYEEELIAGGDDFFIRQFQEYTNAAREKKDTRRSELERRHAKRVQDMRSRILTKTADFLSSPSAKAKRRSQIQRLMDLLQHRKEIEDRIALGVDKLETAFKTTSSEVQTSLRHRIQSVED